MDRAVVDVLKTPVIDQDEPNWACWEEQAKLDFTILLTVHTMNFLRSGRHRVAL